MCFNTNFLKENFAENCNCLHSLGHCSHRYLFLLRTRVYNYLHIIPHSGYYDDDERHRFGTTNKKGQNRPLLNFSFTFVKKILAVSHASTGYVVEVTPECVGGEESGSESELEDSCNPGSRYIICVGCMHS